MKDYFKPEFSEADVNSISNLGLAHLGDGVFELMVRLWLCENGGCTASGMHHKTVQYVNAVSQAKAAERLLPVLTDEELHVFKRGRNTRVNSVPKGASLHDYHAATGLEALMGYLYLYGRIDRVNELFNIVMEDK